jgi:hypothetical protein
MEEGECEHSVFSILKDELANLFSLFLALHDGLWSFGSDWLARLLKDEELQLFELRQFSKVGSFFFGGWEKTLSVF